MLSCSFCTDHEHPSVHSFAARMWNCAQAFPPQTNPPILPILYIVVTLQICRKSSRPQPQPATSIALSVNLVVRMAPRLNGYRCYFPKETKSPCTLPRSFQASRRFVPWLYYQHAGSRFDSAVVILMRPNTWTPFAQVNVRPTLGL